MHRVDVTAHRGSSRFAPENTLSAIRLAIEQGADFVEFDVQQTADGVVVLVHDDDLRRVAGLEKRVGELDYEELSMLDAGSWFSAEFRGERIPTLAEVFDLTRGRIRLNIELKYGRPDPALAPRVVEMIREADCGQQCVVSSLDHAAALEVKSLAPELNVGPIVDRPLLDLPIEAVDFLSVHVDLATAELIRTAHEAGRPVHVWTVNDSGRARSLADLGAANLITDDPPTILAALGRG